MALTLQTLLEGIYSSVIEAGNFVTAQHFKMFESYFERKRITDEVLGETEVYVPRLIAMAYSKIENGEEKFDVYEAPQAALIPMSTLAIETLEMEFEAKIANFEALAETKGDESEAGEAEDPGILKRTFDQLREVAGEVEIMMKGDSMESSASPVKVKITFKIQPPPEGVALIQEQLLDYLRT
ncbi:MAG: DUF2589 domain-containing protein [Rhizobiaceae bacterium]